MRTNKQKPKNPPPTPTSWIAPRTAIYSTCDYCGRWFRMPRWRVHLRAIGWGKRDGHYLAYCGCDLDGTGKQGRA